MARVKIVKTPQARMGIDLGAGASGGYGTNGNRQFSLNNLVQSGKMSKQPTEARGTLQPVPRDEANLEAEAGETAVVNIDGMSAHFKIGGERHSKGGTPLSLPDNSFIFSDTAKMKIKDPIIQAQFGMVPKKSGYTPAEIAKKYDINKFRKVLADPDSEDIDRDTAELMISNYNLKLAKLALLQESIKGFPQGIPVIAMPYLIENEIDPSEFLGSQAQEQAEGPEQPDAETGEAKYGGLLKAQVGQQFNPAWLKGPAVPSITAGAPAGTGSMMATPTMGLKTPKADERGMLANEEAPEMTIANAIMLGLEFPQRAGMWAGTGVRSAIHGSGWTGHGDVDEKGVPYGAKFEMPSDAINANYPGHPATAFAADLISPGMIRAPFAITSRIINKGVKTAATRAVVDDIIKASTDANFKKIKNLNLTEARAKELLATTGREATDKNIKTIQKAYADGSVKALDKVTKKPGLLATPAKLESKIENKVLKSASTEYLKQSGLKAGETVGDIADAFKKTTISRYHKIAAPIKEKFPKVMEKLENAAEFVGEASPYVKPLLLPATRTALAQRQKANAPKITQAKDTGKDGLPLYTHADRPGEYFYKKPGETPEQDSLLPYNPQKGLYGPVTGVTAEKQKGTTRPDTTSLLKPNPAKIDTTKKATEDWDQYLEK
jgi:hypothetical protein